MIVNFFNCLTKVHNIATKCGTNIAKYFHLNKFGFYYFVK
jgi:hypothetical protein